MMDNEQFMPDDFTVDEDFSYSGYQVVRGEFFAHINEPSITFNRYRVYVNTACIKKLPTVRYIQFLVNPNEKKLVLRPCSEYVRDSFQWYTDRNGKRKPRQLSCRYFFLKIVDLMNWNPDFRYKLLGKIIRSNGAYLISFDLTSTEIYQREAKFEGRTKSPIFPAHWKNQFGLPVEEHKRFTQVNVFDGYTVFGISEGNNIIHEEEKNVQKTKYQTDPVDRSAEE